MIPSISIFGNGAIGNLLALRCAKSNWHYQLCTRDGKGFELQATDIEQTVYKLTPNVITSHQPVQSDLVILPLKAYQVEAALKHLTLTPGQILLLLHNGMGTIESAKRLLPNNPILFATTSHAGYKPEPFSFRETGTGQSALGLIQNPGARDLTSVIEASKQLLSPCQWHTDIQLALWHKLAVNAVINPLTAIHQIKNGALGEGEFKAIKQAICAETAQVMTANHYMASAAALLERVDQVIADTADNYSSMNRDIANKRKTEIEAINGFVVAQGQRFNIATPVNRELLRKIQTLTAGF